MSGRHYRVYVVELSRKVYSEHTRFRNANPQYNGVLECLYVGMTSKDPADRFLQHKEQQLSKRGKKLSSTLVKKYGLYLRPSLYTHLEPMSRNEALKMEEALGMELRRKRYAVWFN